MNEEFPEKITKKGQVYHLINKAEYARDPYLDISLRYIRSDKYDKDRKGKR